MPETKNINKVIYAGKTLIDLTSDTVDPSKLLKDTTAHDKSGAVITGTCEYDVDSSDATVGAAEILSGKTAFARGAKVTGTMKNNGAVTKTISDKDQQVTIPVGYHDGSGNVTIDAVEKAKLIPGNIREGITVLGVEGSMSGTEGANPQSKTATPSNVQQTILPDEGYNYLSEVIVEAIPYVESANAAGGITATIAG